MDTIGMECYHCGSKRGVKSGQTRNGKQRYQCRECQRTLRDSPQPKEYSEERKEEILRAYSERTSLRGLTRIFGVSRQTVAAWIKKTKYLPKLEATLISYQEGDILQLDEVWSFVKRRKNKRWIWLALYRRTRQIVAFVIGCRGKRTCKKLWKAIPESYKVAHCFADVWGAYAKVIDTEQLTQNASKANTNHIERFNCTLRQRCGRLVRETFSFSKCHHMHQAALSLFIYKYNLTKLPL